MIRYLIHRPIAVFVVTIAFSLLGILSYIQLPITLLPDISVPEITVQISYPKASAREFQQTIEKPLRNQLLQLSHLENIESITQDGLSIITLSFDYTTNIQFAYLETNEKIDGILSQLPRDLERPKVIKAGSSDIPVFNLNISPGPNYKESFIALSEFSENVLKRRIEQLPEVALVDVSGLSQPEAYVEVKAEKLLSLGLTEIQFSDALKQANIQPGNFSVREGPYQYNIKFSSELTTIQDIENLIINIGEAGGMSSLPQAQIDPRVSYFAENVLLNQEVNVNIPNRLIPLRELANVSIKERTLTGSYSFNGKRAICLAIVMQNDAQLMHLRKELNDQLTQFQTDYPNVEFALSQDQTELLDLAISNLISNLLTGALLTLGMIYFFMRDKKLPLIIGLVIPISILITFLGFFILRLSINIVSLAGLVLGMGEIVDSAIIILENIEEKRENHFNLEDSCIEGTGEVIRPLFTSVLTNSAVFLPLLLLEGLAGVLFFDQAISVSLALGISLLCSYTLVPVLYYSINKNSNLKVSNFSPTLITRLLEKAYNTLFTLAFRFKIGLSVLLIFLIIGASWITININKSGMPKISRSELEVFVNWNEPLTIFENQRRINQITMEFSPEIVYVSEFIGQQQFLLNRQIEQSENEALISLKTSSDGAYEEVSQKIKVLFARYFPLATYDVRPSKNVFEQLFKSSESELILKLHNSKSQQIFNPQIAERVYGKLIGSGLTVTPLSYQNQVYIKLKPDKLLLYNVSQQALIEALKTVFNNNKIIELQSQQRFIPVLLGRTNTLSSWQDSFVYNQQKQAIAIKHLIDVVKKNDYKALYADKEGAYIPFIINNQNLRVTNTQRKVDKLLSSESDFLYGWSGRYFRDKTYLENLMVVISVAIALLFCILTAQFESIQQPLIVLLIILLGLAGAVCFLFFAGNSINVMSAIGFVVLIGLLDNDSILKIDTINRSRSSMLLIDAIRSAGRRRLKSQIMTFLTTILGLLPVLLTGGLGSELQKPLALSVIGGMCVGVLVSWTAIPLLYWWLAKQGKYFS